MGAVTLGSHQKCVGKSQVHLTPKWLIDRFPGFDLDPCAADPRPWDCAFANYTEADGGLNKQWRGSAAMFAALLRSLQAKLYQPSNCLRDVREVRLLAPPIIDFPSP